MSFTRRHLMAGLTVGMMLASVGCGPKPSAMKTEEVEGVVTLDGRPFRVPR